MSTDFAFTVPRSGTPSSVSRRSLWTGRTITGLLALFLLFDAVMKIARVAAVVEGTARAGYPAGLVAPIGVTLLGCLVVYLIPRTSILGAILLTGYFGGATATMVRMQDPWFLFPVGFAVLVWAGLYLRDLRLRTIIHSCKQGAA